jgi:hypothetical protein
MLERASAIE